MSAELTKLADPAELEALRKRLERERDPNRVRARICMTGCRAHGAEEIFKAFNEEVQRRGLEKRVEVMATGCHGFCARAPVMVIDPYDFFYGGIKPEDVPCLLYTSPSPRDS